MELATKLKILDEAVCVTLCTNVLVISMYLSFLLTAMGK